MFAKTFCKPGAFLSIVPVGLRTTLQYSATGTLEKIFVGYDDNNRTNISSEILKTVKEKKLVPLVIPVKGGTTWVKGVFYTSKRFSDKGVLPMCIENSIISDIKQNPSDYNFYAGNVDSLATSFRGALTIRNWLSMSKFNLLPSWVIPADMNRESFIKMVGTEKYPFQFPLISGYMIYEGNEFRYLPLCLVQSVVSKVCRYNDPDGNIRATLVTDSKDIFVNYSDVIRYNIHTNTLVVQEPEGRIVFTDVTDNKKRDKRSAKLTCSICGKTFIAATSGPVCCDDIHCRSKLYPDIVHFLKVLNLSGMDYLRFAKLVESGEILCLTDVLLLDEYKELVIETTLDKLIESVVPVSVCSDPSVFTMFASSCNNSVKTLQYYLDNPQKLITDLNISSVFVKRLIEWLSDGYNVSTLITLLESKQITLISSNKKFQGAPIFRDMTILITGRFKHGDMGEIISILQSYEAKVVTHIEPNIKCLIVGDLKENIDGRLVKYARESNIAIFDESDFFSRYEIDEDLTSNLL